jgi:DNA-binding beta-propeller fold protein YncE
MPRSRLALFLPLGLIAALSAQPAMAGGLALVINAGSASISVVDMGTGQEVRRIPVLREAHHWALSPDGKSLLIGDTGGNELLLLDPATGALQRRVPCADPYQLGFSPNGKMLVVTGLARGQVDVYDAASYTLIKRFPLKSMPSHLDFSADSSTVYISLQGSNRVAALDLKKMAVLWDAPVGPAPAGVMLWRGRLFVAIMGADYVAMLDPATGAVIGHLQAGKGAHQMFLSPDHRTLYVNSRIDSTISAYDSTTLALQRSYKVPGGPDDLIFPPDGHIWATLRFAGKVGVLDPKTGVVETFPVGRSPHGIYIQGAVNSGSGVR